jgi:hypothetical protein
MAASISDLAFTYFANANLDAKRANAGRDCSRHATIVVWLWLGSG